MSWFFQPLLPAAPSAGTTYDETATGGVVVAGTADRLLNYSNIATGGTVAAVATSSRDL